MDACRCGTCLGGSDGAAIAAHVKRTHAKSKVGLGTILVGVMVAMVWSGCGDGSDADPIARALPTTRSERTWVDESRDTVRGATVLAEGRGLRTVIWRPETDAPRPLLVMAHGFTGLPEKFAAMAAHIAAAGYVVAAPAFPLTNQNALGGAWLPDVRQQPADVSFVLDRLLEANATAGDDLRGRIDEARIAVLGHSLGGTTTIALTRKACCRDPRVTASLLVAPGPIDLFVQLFGLDPTQAGPPTMILQGTDDPIISYESAYAYFQQIDAPAYFVGIDGATHSDAIEAAQAPLTYLESVSARAIVAFLDQQFGREESNLDATLATLADEGQTTASRLR